jgi:hypothetical protein
MSTNTTHPPTPLPLPKGSHEQLDALAAKQGVTGTGNYEAMLGKGQHLWKDDAELESFLEAIHQAKRESE